PRYPQPLRDRRERLPNLVRRQPDRDYHCECASLRRASDRERATAGGASVTAVTPVEFDTESRTTLAALADVLVPEAEGMPAASQVDVHGKWLDRVLRVRPDLAPDLARVLAEARGRDPVAEVARLQQE